MTEVHTNLFVGSQADLTPTVHDYAIVHAAKDPWHRQAVGYTERAAPKDHPEYLFAHRRNRLSLNLIDAAYPQFIPDAVMDEGCKFIGKHLAAGSKVLVHCNQGQSRGPGLAFYYLWKSALLPEEFEVALAEFKKVYPAFNPASGILGFLKVRCVKRGEVLQAETIEEQSEGPVSDEEFLARFG